MTQTWHDLLFAHWPLPPGAFASLVPRDFELDLFDDRAWLGIVPFRMANVAPRGMPALPWVSAFPELNVRTYVRAAGRPGVYFFSLDAANRLAVLAARLALRLPYHAAAMRCETTPAGVAYASRRKGRGPAAVFEASYEPTGPVFHAGPGSLEHFLTERYALFAYGHRGRPYRLDIHHVPWPLQVAGARIDRNTMASAAGITLPPVAPVLHFSKRQDVLTWMPDRT
jgi:hypothetical protein